MAINVNARFQCREVVGDARNGEYLLPDRCTVREFMEHAAEENGTFVDNYMDFVLFIVSGKIANADTVLEDSDSIKVLGMVYGG